MLPIRLAVLISGRGSNLAAILEVAKLCWQGKVCVSCVISSKADSVGLNVAITAGIPVSVFELSICESKSKFEEHIHNFLLMHHIDLVCLAGFMHILQPDFIGLWEGRIINIHPSLLPSFSGLYPQKQALDCGVTISGCTVHHVNENVDDGKIIMQAAVPVLVGDNVESLSNRILKAEHICYPLAIEKILGFSEYSSISCINTKNIDILYS